LREIYFRIGEKLTKKLRAVQKETVWSSKKRHQFVREKYKKRVNA
jgi:hypothetical protein